MEQDRMDTGQVVAARSRYANAPVRFGKMGWVAEFTYPTDLWFGVYDKVIVQTDRGTELGEILTLTCENCAGGGQVGRDQMALYVQNSGADYLRPKKGKILRQATAQDVNEARRLEMQAREELNVCREMAAGHNLQMRLVVAEHLFGGERIVFYFTADARVDFRSLVKDLAAEFQTRIEMRQIGARDEARLVGDYDICGQQCCCKNFLKVLKPVSMAMAKVQKATLDPTKISGRCGRLRCCLRYENDCYDELLAALPRIGEIVRIPDGQGRVIDRQALTQLVMVELDPEHRVAVHVDDIVAQVESGNGGRSRPAQAADQVAEHLPAAADDRAPEADEANGRPADEAEEAAGPVDVPSDGQPARKKRRRRRRRRPGGPPAEAGPGPQRP